MFITVLPESRVFIQVPCKDNFRMLLLTYILRLFDTKDFLHSKPIAFTHRKVCAANLHLVALQAFNLMNGDNIGFMNT